MAENENNNSQYFDARVVQTVRILKKMPSKHSSDKEENDYSSNNRYQSNTIEKSSKEDM